MSTLPTNPSNVGGILRISDLKNTDLTPQQYDGEARLGEIVIDVSTPVSRANPRMWIGNVSGNLFEVGIALANGNSGEVQYNNGNQFAASPNFVWDNANSTLTIVGNITATGNISGNGGGNGTFVANNIDATGNIEANGNMTIGGTSLFNGEVVANSNVLVNGDSTFNGNIITRANVFNEGTVYNTGTVYNNADTYLNGDTTANGNVAVNGAFTTTGNVINTGNVLNLGNVVNDGNTFLNGNTTSNGVFTTNGDLVTLGNVLNSGTVYNNADTYLNGETTANGNVLINGTLTTTANVVSAGNMYLDGNTVANGAVTVNGNLTTTGNVLNQGTVTNNALTFLNGDTTSNANLTVAGVIAANGNITGNSNLSVTGNITGGSNLAVTGNITGGNIQTVGTTTTGNLVVTNSSNLGQVANVHIFGGNTGEALLTDGAGNLSWGVPVAQIANRIANGTSNVSLPVVDGNIQMAVAGAANVWNFGDQWLNGVDLITVSPDALRIGINTGNAQPSASYGVDSIHIGNGAGASATGDDRTVIIGVGAGVNSGDDAVAIGTSAGSNAQGTRSVAIGWGAGSNTQGQQSTALGSGAGNAVQGAYSVAVGAGAAGNTQGANSVAMGANAGANTQGSFAVALGNDAGKTTQGANAVALGSGAGATAQAARAVAVGRNAGATDQGIAAVAIGDGAGAANMGDYSLALGFGAGNLDQANNTIVLNATGANFAGGAANGFYVKPVRNDVANLGNLMLYNNTSGEITFAATDLIVQTDRISNGTSNVAITTVDGPVTMDINGTANVYTFAETELVADNIITVLANGYVALGSGANTQVATGAVRIGENAGSQSPASAYSVHLGTDAGTNSSAANTIAIGREAGSVAQGANAIAIGPRAGYTNQGADSVVLGISSGNNIGALSVAIGARAVANNAANNTISINATGSNIAATTANALYIKPVRNDPTIISNIMFYSQGTGEVTYAAASILTGNVSRLVNGTSNVDIASTNGNVTVGIGGTASVFDIGATSTVMKGDLLPQASNSADLGSGTQRWGNLYLSNSSLWLGGVHVTSDDVDTVNIPNANIGNLDVVGNITGSNANITSNLNVVSTITAANANIGNLIIANSTFVNLAVTQNANVANLRANGTANLGAVGNVKITGGSSGQVLSTDGSANLSWVTIDTAIISNGNSNVSVVANANVNTSAGGVANVFVVTPTGANVNGTLGVSSTANFATNVNIAGNTVITGNLTVNGNTNYVNVSGLQIEDPVIEVGGGPNGANLITNDGKDRGVQMHYYTTQPVDAFMGWDNSNAEFAFGSNVTVANDVATFNTFGNVRAANYIGNGVFTNLSATGLANLGAVGNLRITGGTSGQALTTHGNGVVYWATAPIGTQLANGTSNVVVNASANVVVSVSGVDATASFESDRLVVNQLEILSNSINLGSGSDAAANSVSIGVSAGASGQNEESVAIGMQAGENSQATQSVAIGKSAGGTNQAAQAVAVGLQAGITAQGSGAVAVGGFAGNTTQGSVSVAVGYNAGKSVQGTRSVAVGNSAGTTNQSTDAVAVGSGAGATNQRSNAVAIGGIAGTTSQGNHAVAVGYSAGTSGQANYAIAIGSRAGNTSQGLYSVAIGANAGNSSQANNSIIINASGSNLTTATANSLYINPVRGDATNNSNVMFYNTTTKEITYAAISTVTVNTDRIANGTSNVTIPVADGSVVGYSAGNLIIRVEPSGVGNGTVALGGGAGNLNQGEQGVALGMGTAAENQGNFAVAIGSSAGALNQGTLSVAIGHSAASIDQAAESISIGYISQTDGVGAIAIGAGAQSAYANSIALGKDASSTGANQFHVKTVRYNAATQTTANFTGMFYNTTTNEIASGPILYAGWGNTRVGVTGENGTGYVRAASNANVMTWSNTGVAFSAVANLGNVANVKIAGGTSGQFIVTDGSGTLSFADVATANFANYAGNVTLASQPNITSLGTLTGLNVGGVSNLGPVGNVIITGGSSGQLLRTDGAGNLSWITLSTSSLVNGNSNVVVTANGNVTTSVAGTANVLVVTATGANVAGTVTATGNVSGANLTTAGRVTATGNITGGNLITTGNVEAGNLTVTALSTLGAVGNVKITGGSSGQVLRTDGTGNLSWVTVGNISNIANGNSNVSINSSGGNVTIGVTGTANVVTISSNALVAPNLITVQDSYVVIGSNSATGTALTGGSTKVGSGAGKLSDGGTGTTMVGYLAGYEGAAANVTALGALSGYSNAAANTIALGFQSGYANMKIGAISIGAYSGNNMGAYSVAIGTNGVANAAANNTISLNATGTALTAGTANALYVAPVRQDTANTTVGLFYNSTTKEVTYSTTPAPSALANLRYVTELVNVTGTTTSISSAYSTAGSIIYSSGATANLSVNFTGVNATQAANTTATMAVIVNQGSTPRSISSFQLDSVAQTVKWVDGVIPVGQSNCVQVFTYTALKTAASTWTVLGQVTRYA